MSQQLLYESVGEIVLLVDNYYLLNRVTYCCNLKWCDWCGGVSSYISSSVIWTSSISNKSVYDPPCLNKCFMNWLGRSFFLFTHYLHRIIYLFNVTWCNWCRGGSCDIILSVIWTSRSNSNRSVYDPPCPNKCFTNLLNRSNFCSLITISYIEFHTCSIWHGVIGVEEVDVTLFPP